MFLSFLFTGHCFEITATDLRQNTNHAFHWSRFYAYNCLYMILVMIIFCNLLSAYDYWYSNLSRVIHRSVSWSLCYVLSYRYRWSINTTIITAYFTGRYKRLHV